MKTQHDGTEWNFRNGCRLPTKKATTSITLRKGTGTPLQYPRLENPMDGGAW